MVNVKQALFQKDRNLHADLLLKCIQEGSWTEPMDKHPPEGPLPCLPRYVACSLRRARAERIARAKPEAITLKADGCNPLQGSLASAATAAMGKPEAHVASSGPMQVSVAAPPAYAALAARVAHLELQNKQLRKQLLEARKRSERSASPAACRSVAARPHTPRGAFTAVPPEAPAVGFAAAVTAPAPSETGAAPVVPAANVPARLQPAPTAPSLEKPVTASHPMPEIHAGVSEPFQHGLCISEFCMTEISLKLHELKAVLKL